MTELRSCNTFILIALATSMLSTCSRAPEPEATLSVTPDVAQRLAQFVPTVVEADLSTLSESERQVLDKLIEAGQYMDQAFLRQAWPENPTFREQLARQEGELTQPALAYFDVMYGPWDRLAHREPFVGQSPPSSRGRLLPRGLDQGGARLVLRRPPEAKGEPHGLVHRGKAARK